MKTRLYIFVATLLMAVSAMAQSNNSGVALSMAVPDFDENFDESAAKALMGRLNQIMSKSGMGSAASDFVVIPKVIIHTTDLIEGGMKNIYRIDGDLALEVMQLSTGNKYGSTSVSISGKGMRAKKEAVKDAVRKIKPTDPGLTAFFEETRNKIATYFLQNKNAIISKARAAASRKDYEQAIAILSTYPDGLEGYDDIDKELVSVFRKYRETNCEQALLQARSAVAVKNYDYALELLRDVDPQSDCASKANALLSAINKEVRDAEARERADLKEDKEMALELQKSRLNAARDVAKAYYSRTQPTYNFIYR